MNNKSGTYSIQFYTQSSYSTTTADNYIDDIKVGGHVATGSWESTAIDPTNGGVNPGYAIKSTSVDFSGLSATETLQVKVNSGGVTRDQSPTYTSGASVTLGPVVRTRGQTDCSVGVDLASGGVATPVVTAIYGTFGGLGYRGDYVTKYRGVYKAT